MRTYFKVVLLIGLVVSCGRGAVGTSEPIPDAWIADIYPFETASPLAGFASMSILPSDETRANLTLNGAVSGTSHPWRVRVGVCGDTGEVVGSEDSYPQLEVFEDGRASATATLSERLTSKQKYSVAVFGWGDDPVEIACGDFVRN